MEFNNRALATVEIFGQELWITETHVSTWIVMGILIVLAILVRVALTRFTEVPTGKQNVIELAVESFDNFVKNTMGPENRAYGMWFFGVFIFIMASNFSGLLGMRPPTADLSTTLVFSVTTFLLVTFSAILKKPKEYFKSFFEPLFVLFPVNVIGELSIIISLSVRMFGNILSGLIVLGIVYYLLPTVLTIAIPAALHFYFDVFAGAIQAFIFTILSMIFIKNKI
ncbi:MAG: F0F1 ATP synthase subunit A [Defluviitaleaceae bacterium]|nr:F0F1 ATP synthase subunit A [Defluviitaleaceae bacterium]